MTNSTNPTPLVPNADLPTRFGNFKVMAFPADSEDCHLCLILGNPSNDEPVLVRIHSKCTTGDMLGSLRCDCGAQLSESLKLIAEAGKGVLIYLDQEGRGIGLCKKIEAYGIQDRTGADTLEANIRLGEPVDSRQYEVAAAILHSIGVTDLILLSNNPRKLAALREAGLKVQPRSLVVGVNQFNVAYLETKRAKLGHAIPNDLSTLTSKQSTVTDSKDDLGHLIEHLLESLGLAPYLTSMEATATRVADMYREVFSGVNVDTKEVLSSTIPFASASDRDQLVTLTSIRFYSMCEHHFLPFFGFADIAFIPDRSIVGLGKLTRLVNSISRRPQLQERLTDECLKYIESAIGPKGAAVHIVARHMCEEMRGVRQGPQVLHTFGFLGRLREECSERAAFMQTITNQV